MSNKRPLTSEELAMASTVKAAIAAIPGMTEERLGGEAGVTQGAVSHWTSGRLAIPAKRAAAVAKALRIADPGSISLAYREIVGPLSHTTHLDPHMLLQTHHALCRRFKREGRVFDIEKYPEVFAEAYAIRVGIVGASIPQNVFDLVIEHADLTPQGTSTDGRAGRGDGMPATGSTGRKVGAGQGRKA